MIEFVKGRLIEKNPAYVVIDCHGIGYLLHISLNTYTQIGKEELVSLFTHQVIREDAHLLFGFSTKDERLVFRNLLSVSGVGASTARMVLSSIGPDEVKLAIASGSVTTFQKIKGIGAKTAQRIIVDLSGKIDKIDLNDSGSINSTLKNEALGALTTLGFDKAAAEKAINKIIGEDNNLPVEQLIKLALKNM